MKIPKYLPALAIAIASLYYGCTKDPTVETTQTFTFKSVVYRITDTKTNLPTCKVNPVGVDDRVVEKYKDVVGIVTKKYNKLDLANYYIKIIDHEQLIFFANDPLNTKNDVGVRPCNLPQDYQVEGLMVKIEGSIIDAEILFSPVPTILTNISKLAI